jgi:hypothetical protein
MLPGYRYHALVHERVRRLPLSVPVVYMLLVEPAVLKLVDTERVAVDHVKPAPA